MLPPYKSDRSPVAAMIMSFMTGTKLQACLIFTFDFLIQIDYFQLKYTLLLIYNDESIVWTMIILKSYFPLKVSQISVKYKNITRIETH